MKYLLAALALLPIAAPAFGADAVPTYTDAAGKTWLLDHPTETPAPPKPTGIFGWTDVGWATNFELGASGSSGNTEVFTVHAGLTSLHEDADGRTKLGASYDHTVSEGVISANRFVAEGTHDFFNAFPKESKWGLFGNIRYEYNDFVEWNHRLSAFVGPTYRILKDDTYTLIGRAGFGGTYQDNGTRNNGHFIPEAQIGADFTWKIDERQKFEASTTFYPSLEETGDFRNISTAAYYLAIDTHKSLKLAAEYNYNSTQTTPYRKGDFKWWVTLAFTL